MFAIRRHGAYSSAAAPFRDAAPMNARKRARELLRQSEAVLSRIEPKTELERALVKLVRELYALTAELLEQLR